nr:unnamed protein product [Digitaria exilis]
MMASARPLAVVLLAAAVALMLAATAINPAAAGVTGGGAGGRMLIIRRAPPGTPTSGGGGRSRWKHQTVEDEVAPEFGAMLATNGRFVSSGALTASKAVCIRNCGGKGGGSYTRPCTYKGQCRGG